jgi:hypothetical protein
VADQDSNELTPAQVMEQVALAMPEACRPHVIIIGSLAAGYHFFGHDRSKAIRTKDVDAMFSPHAMAAGAAREVTESLLAAHWSIRDQGEWGQPGDAETPNDKLPLVRLKPPHRAQWFLELMSAPAGDNDGRLVKTFDRLETRMGHFALCSFGFLGLAEHAPLQTPWGVRCARPEMMALANLLHHPSIGTATISGGFFGAAPVKRANKDLGRVLALAYLSLERDRDAMKSWSVTWRAAIEERYPEQAEGLLPRIGAGLLALMGSREDFNQAARTCSLGLLQSMDVGPAALEATARRLLAEAIDPLAE